MSKINVFLLSSVCRTHVYEKNLTSDFQILARIWLWLFSYNFDLKRQPGLTHTSSCWKIYCATNFIFFVKSDHFIQIWNFFCSKNFMIALKCSYMFSNWFHASYEPIKWRAQISALRFDLAIKRFVKVIVKQIYQKDRLLLTFCHG